MTKELAKKLSIRKYDSTIRAKRALATKKKIAKALQTLIIEGGTLNSVLINDICNKAGVSVATFYIHFQNKEQALLYIYRDSDDYYTSLRLYEMKPLDGLKAILHNYLNDIPMDKVNLIRQLYIAHLTCYDEYFFDQERGLLKRIREQLEKLNHQGMLKEDYSIDEILHKLVNFARGQLYNLAIHEPIIDKNTWNERAKEDMDNYINIFLI